MRLLNVYTFEFAEFEGDHLPPYKITSHRWTKDEVTFEDVLGKKKTGSEGYVKIEGFCQFIREDEERLRKYVTKESGSCEWIWIDTACIDKRSSAEVSESINSMFVWYDRAIECFAYLADVPSLSAGNEIVMSEFQRSEWFYRGWTLQELLVPRVVIFLNKDWEVIGHKCKYCEYSNPCRDAGPLLNDVVADITGISEDILFDYKRSNRLSVAQKLTWMADRETTKPEDMAYCLLGIFNITMPPLYGDGPKVMEKLEKELANKAPLDEAASGAVHNLKSRIKQMDRQTRERMDGFRGSSIRPATDVVRRPRLSCEVASCVSTGVSFARKCDLLRHQDNAHGSKVRLYECDLPGCHRQGAAGFTRLDKMREHVRDHRRRSRRSKSAVGCASMGNPHTSLKFPQPYYRSAC